MAEWIVPKTDWKEAEDRFNISDYNRIKNNLEYLYEKANELYKSFNCIDMGDDITSYEAYYDVDVFNAFEKNLDTINNSIFTQDLGTMQTFYPNGMFIKFDELNRIESAMLAIKNILERQAAAKRRLSFTLGAYKEVKI